MLGAASVMSVGSLCSYRFEDWLEATVALPWTGRGKGGGVGSHGATGPGAPGSCCPSCHSIVRYAGASGTVLRRSLRAGRSALLRRRGVLGRLLRGLLERPYLGQ